jgi:hypothetical protein
MIVILKKAGCQTIMQRSAFMGQIGKIEGESILFSPQLRLKNNGYYILLGQRFRLINCLY